MQNKFNIIFFCVAVDLKKLIATQFVVKFASKVRSYFPYYISGFEAVFFALCCNFVEIHYLKCSEQAVETNMRKKRKIMRTKCTWYKKLLNFDTHFFFHLSVNAMHKAGSPKKCPVIIFLLINYNHPCKKPSSKSPSTKLAHSLKKRPKLC